MAKSQLAGGRRHAEYKIPGGKLLVVDLLVEDGHLHDVQLSGDFFLEPPETLDAINAALVGLPADGDAASVAQALAPVITADVMLFGITVDGIAVVIQRALA
ncbi:MAG TPA: biotin--protein ligase [Castellaniella sp.]|uniref:biotin--protein ligase n=1 Tax=Castellaniella sp. TaxID=1955812 RepID=UPI002F1726FF